MGKYINIAFDLDGTLIDFMKIGRDELRKMYGAEVIEEDRRFKIETTPPLSNNQIWKAFKKAYTRWEETPIFEGTYEVLSKLHRHAPNDYVTIITARPSDYMKDTFFVVDRVCKDIPFRLIIVGGGHMKEAELDRLGIDVYVEDRGKTAESLARGGRKVYLLDRPYNQHTPDRSGIVRIKHVRDLYNTADNFIGVRKHKPIVEVYSSVLPQAA